MDEFNGELNVHDIVARLENGLRLSDEELEFVISAVYMFDNFKINLN